MKTLNLEVNAGLGNRIRAMISGICWAEKLCRRLVIWWPVKPECAAAFSILFNGSRLPDWVEVRDTMSSEVPTQVLSPDDARSFFEGKDDIDALYIKSHGCFWPRTDGVANMKWLSYLRALQPSVTVEDVYSRWKSQGLLCGNVIHIRGTDNEKARRLSPLSMFKSAIVDETGENFTLISDDTDLLLEMYECFGERMHIPERIRQRHTEEGMIEATAAFFVLARAFKVLGSANSSFSEIARDYGSCLLKIVH
jgi:hypothetical protein